MDKSLKFDYRICVFQGDDEGGRVKSAARQVQAAR